MARKSDLIGYVYKYRLYLGVFILLAMPVALFLLYMDSPTKASIAEEPYSIIILAGQSNAEGSNTIRARLPAGNGVDKQNDVADDQTGLWVAGADGNGPTDLNDYIKVFSGQSVAGWYDSTKNNDPNDKLVDLSYTQLKGVVGSDIGMGRYLYQMGRRKVIILKVTYGFQSLATSTSQYVPFDWNINSNNKSYARLKSEFGLLTQKIKADGGTYTVDGFMWMQGETDTLQESYTAAYQSNLTALTNAARTDFQMHPDAHFVIGKISMNTCIEGSYPNTGNYCGFPYLGGLDTVTVAPLNFAQPYMADRVRRVRNAMQAVADLNPKVDVVETADLARGTDWIHLNELSHIELGRRFVNMYKLPLRYDSDSTVLPQNSNAADFDGDSIANPAEDTGRGGSCQLAYEASGNGNLGDDDSDCDGYPNYLDSIIGEGSGI